MFFKRSFKKHKDKSYFLSKKYCDSFFSHLRIKMYQSEVPLLRPGGLCLYDSDLVQPSQRLDADLKGLPMYRKVMEKVGKANTLNICVLGALITLTGAIRMESIQKMLADRFRPAFHAANNAALELGAELARPLV